MELDSAEVAAFVRTRLGGDIDAVERIGHGEWSTAFSLRKLSAAGAEEFVVRFGATDDDFLKDQRAMGYASAELPVPKIVEIGEAGGGFYALSERAYGQFIEQLDEAGMRRLLPSLFATLDAARRIVLADGGGYGLWRGVDGLAPHATWRAAVLAMPAAGERIHGWRERLDQSPSALRAFKYGSMRLRELIDFCPEERHLVHSDLLYFNVLVDGERISAVLDWGSAMYGDFLWDLAWFTFWQPWYTAWSAVDLRAAAREHYGEICLAVPHFEQRMRCYELAIGLDGLAYQAFAGHTASLEWTTQRVLNLL